ncbi:hypothetical protein WH87_02760 [Devosia epidermidihirudinis]|uniref:Fumarylacetoacetase-like C-terminal domain-containing protein n=1 Tax=Devosia epidermidihirudinis TaxID=1293439 RepID=A0A0F5QK34_9HYPH|nr:fumarylacetoacetate hydrolase family protein [Devosia epidermidihirudinis]KKC41076.1 hypothetical protein WH87_02760 [Devosia epidermidihirudinis]
MSKAVQAAALLAEVRETGVALTGFPAELVPEDRSEIYALQDALIAALGPVGGWKIAAGSEAVPLCSPLLEGGYLVSGDRLSIADNRLTVVEVEVGFRFKSALPPRSNPYDRDEVLAAIEGALTAIEMVGIRFAPGVEVPRAVQMGDLQVNAAVVTGAVVADWEGLDLGTLKVRADIGAAHYEVDTGTSTEAVIDALVWLANEGALRQGGLKAGEVVITGARINQPVGDAGDLVVASIEGLGEVRLMLA